MTEFLPTVIYVLCFLTSVACAAMLGRSYAQSRNGMLLWSSISFGFLAVNNLVLVLDMVVWPTGDLRLLRLLLALAAAASLIWGFVWEIEES
jgi:hypothetical protein